LQPINCYCVLNIGPLQNNFMKAKFEKFTLTCLMILLTQTIWAQTNATIKGSVRDAQTGKSLAGACVEIISKNTCLASITSLDGNYTINNVPAGKYTISINHMGYISRKIKKLPIFEGDKWIFNLELKKAPLNDTDTIIVNKHINKNDLQKL